MSRAFDAVLFDCDGVLVDSEFITCGALRDCLADIGWEMSLAACMAQFVGHTVRSQQALIEAQTGQPFREEWLEGFLRLRNERLAQSLEAVPGILGAVTHLHQALAGQIAVASGADRFKIEMMLGKVGLRPFFEGRMFSGQETPRNKPHPDVYLAAAAHLGVPIERCLVIEDTPVCAQAGVAAGATVWVYAVHGQAASLQAAGVQRVFDDMQALSAIP